MSRIFLTIALILAASSASAESLPLRRPPAGGSPPFGYVTSGSFYVPTQGASDAIPKPQNGTCPWGWLSSGSYCLRQGR
jgi:hypothetical protein